MRELGSIILEQPLDVIELFLRPSEVAETLAQLLDDAAGALHVDLARYLDREVVAIVMAAQWPAKRVGVLIGARLAKPADPAGPLALPHLLLHRLRQRLRALAQGVERAALRVNGVVGVALAEIACGVAHRLAGAAKLIHFVLALALLTLLALLAFLVLAKTAVFQLVEQLVFSHDEPAITAERVKTAN